MATPTIAECRELLGPQAESMTDAEVQALSDELREGARLLLRVSAERDRGTAERRGER